jgi:hypothetical protein
MAVVALRQQHRSGQHGGGLSQCGSSAAAGSKEAVLAVWRRRRWQHAGGSQLGGCAEVWRHCSVSGGSRAGGATLPPRATTVVTKTPAATAMAGALPTINNQLKAAAAMAMETTTTLTNKT